MTTNITPNSRECNLPCPVCTRKMYAGDECKTTSPCMHKLTCSCGFSTVAYGIDCNKDLYAFGGAEALDKRYKLLEQERAAKEQKS